MDKQLALQLIDELERLTTETLVLRQYVNKFHKEQEIRRKKHPEIHPAPTALQLIEARRRILGKHSLANPQLAGLRAQVEQGTDWERIAGELLQFVQFPKKVN